jgi:TolB-like protein
MEYIVVTYNSVYLVRGNEVIQRSTFEDGNRYFLEGTILNPEQLRVGGTLLVSHDGGLVARLTSIQAIIARPNRPA